MTVNVFEALFGKQGEVKIESLESDLKFCTGIFKNGTFERRITPIGEFIRQVNNTEIPYLNLECKPSFNMSLPKIPIGMLFALEKFYIHVAQTIKSEVVAQIYWDLQDKKYVFHVPIQEVTGATVRFNRETGFFVDSRYVCVCNSHSHNTFSAFFSGVDDRNEIDTCTYLVIGNVTSPQRTYALRAGCNASYTTMLLSDLFDFNDLSDHYEISHNEMIKITEKPPTVFVGGANSRVYSYGKTNPQGIQITRQNGSNYLSNQAIGTPNLGGRTVIEDPFDYEGSIYDMYEMYENVPFLEDTSMYTPAGRQWAYDKYTAGESLYASDLNRFGQAFNMLADAINDDPNASDVGYTFIYDIVELYEALNFEPLDVMKTFFDNFYVHLKQSDIESFAQYIMQTA